MTFLIFAGSGGEYDDGSTCSEGMRTGSQIREYSSPERLPRDSLYVS